MTGQVSSTKPYTPWYLKVFIRVFEQIETGSLKLKTPFGDFTLGQGGAPFAEVQIHNPRVFSSFLLGGPVAGAESYVRGEWDSPNLLQVVRFMAANINQLQRSQRWSSKLTYPAKWLGRLLSRNTLKGSKENISAHYDLGNDLFEQFLDPSMMYSAAIFPEPHSTLEHAQQHRLKVICQKLDLKSTDTLLEIGTGWGALAEFAAREYGCQVVTTTISEQQFLAAKERIERAGLQNKVTLLKKDYRQLEGQFDKLVSIEMIEAVGKEYLNTYLQQCNRLLKNDGAMLLQAITMPDQKYGNYCKGQDFIQKHIFPGGHLPSLGHLQNRVGKLTDLQLSDVHDITEDYALTLNHWRQRFNQQSQTLNKLGYDQRFQRLWNYYFCYCEGGFIERAINTFQLLYTKPGYRGRVYRG
jgi:cyclopropane-fatty-acyl-phospholipid synthase